MCSIAHRLPEPANYRDQQIQYIPATAPVQRVFRHTTWGDLVSTARQAPAQGAETRVIHIASCFLPSAPATSCIRCRSTKSEEETEDLLGLIMIITAGMIILLCWCSSSPTACCCAVSGSHFTEPYRSQGVQPIQPRTVCPSATDIEEFRRLDDAATRQMTNKIIRTMKC